MKYVIPFILLLFVSLNAYGELKKEIIEYRHGDTLLEGYLVYDDSFKQKRPGVLVIHEWTGINENVKNHADEIARLGYVAFSLDMYGKGVRPKNVEEASYQASIYRKDRGLMRERAKAGMETLRQHELVDSKKIAAIGYCFGGGAVLELARSGADINGVVIFHGNMDTPNPADAKNIKAKVLVLHGADDPHVADEQVISFLKEMRQAGIDFQLIIYGGAVHSFTNPFAGNDNSKGAAYNEKADRRSWKAMQQFFDEIFQ